MRTRCNPFNEGMAMKIKDVFDTTTGGTVCAKLKVTMVDPQGAAGVLGPGGTINPTSSVGGFTGEWIAEHLDDDVPPSWNLPAR